MEHRPIDFTESHIRATLSGLPLGGLRVYDTIGSTNDAALEWAGQGAPDLSVVIADEQTSGRGRSGRKWYSPAGSALAFSVVVRSQGSRPSDGRLAGLGAMAVSDVCDDLGLPAEIKWPNDVLIRGKKVAGVLVETSWNGEQPTSSVIGIGVNVLRGSYPAGTVAAFAPTSIEEQTESPPDRIAILRAILDSLTNWHRRIDSYEFRAQWERRLAYRGQRVRLELGTEPPLVGLLDGLDIDGGLLLHTRVGQVNVRMGEMHLLTDDDTID